MVVEPCDNLPDNEGGVLEGVFLVPTGLVYFCFKDEFGLTFNPEKMRTGI